MKKLLCISLILFAFACVYVGKFWLIISVLVSFMLL